MERYTNLPQREKTKRRQQGLANYVYVRYTDAFVVLGNGTKAQAEALREELHLFREHSLFFRRLLTLTGSGYVPGNVQRPGQRCHCIWRSGGPASGWRWSHTTTPLSA
jgi:hypothetical protein